jgi:glutathione S-transferase
MHVHSYFNVRGHGQRVRYALAGAGLDWEEVLLTQLGAMEAVKPECLFTQVPLLEMDGLKLVQSWAIVRYLGSKDGLSPAHQVRGCTRAAHSQTLDPKPPFARAPPHASGIPQLLSPPSSCRPPP